MNDARVRDIAVGVLINGDGRLLIAQRRPGTPGAGRWEFPGGKHESGETIADCLARELAEEIGVTECRAQPLIRFSHDYGEKPVCLHVWRIDGWSGKPTGREGQSLRWVTPVELADIDLLPATDVILHALDLPSRYVITPGVETQYQSAWFECLGEVLGRGDTLLRLRAHELDDADYAQLAERVVGLAHDAGARVLIDRDVAMMRGLGADGLHWSAERVRKTGARPVGRDCLLAVSAHTSDDLAVSCGMGADFAVLSPVRATPTHPRQQPLGWSAWCERRGEHALPVYALGGLETTDIETATRYNAQGMAAIRAFWPQL